jgi:hypothetical protein
VNPVDVTVGEFSRCELVIENVLQNRKRLVEGTLSADNVVEGLWNEWEVITILGPSDIDASVFTCGHGDFEDPMILVEVELVIGVPVEILGHEKRSTRCDLDFFDALT